MISKEFLIQREDDKYPPHHEGDHLEEYFLKFWEQEKTERRLIPVHWTAVYNYKSKEGLGKNTPNGKLRDELRRYLNSLDRNEKYFVVCTHDDAPSEDLPPDTLVFGAGGNSRRINIPIPLTSSAHRDVRDVIKTIPISFVGSITHKIRYDLLNSMYQKPGVVISADNWTPKISDEKIDLFKRLAEQSIFSLCPRGYGATSYRLYEAMQIGSIPVYVSDYHLLPWSDELDWSEFCVVRTERQIQSLYSELIEFKGSSVHKMQDKLYSTWKEYFSIEGSCMQILKRLK